MGLLDQPESIFPQVNYTNQIIHPHLQIIIADIQSETKSNRFGGFDRLLEIDIYEAIIKDQDYDNGLVGNTKRIDEVIRDFSARIELAKGTINNFMIDTTNACHTLSPNKLIVFGSTDDIEPILKYILSNLIGQPEVDIQDKDLIEQIQNHNYKKQFLTARDNHNRIQRKLNAINSYNQVISTLQGFKALF